jgi:hypothetical protein
VLRCMIYLSGREVGENRRGRCYSCSTAGGKLEITGQRNVVAG